MSDHADIVREALCDLLERVNATMSETRSALAALDALVDEIRSLNEQVVGAVDLLEGAVAERDELERLRKPLIVALAQAEAEVARLRKALTVIAEWDCLNPPDSELCADHPWLKRHVDAALGEDA